MKYLFIVAALLLSACVSAGVKVDQSKMANFKKGRTTYDEVIAQLGQPNQTMLRDDGFKTITYMYFSAQPRPESFIPYIGAVVGGADVENTMVMLTFDKRDILRNFTSTQGRTGSGRGFEAISQPRTNQPRVQ